MDITVAKTAGFCFGVKRAVEKLELEAEKSPVSTLGPIIHNAHVVEKLKKKGVESINNLNALKSGVRLAIRTHGVGRQITDEIKRRGIECIDLTCPFVKKIHNIVSQKYKDGYKIVIAGDENHPEVQGINGWCNMSAFIAASPESLKGKLSYGDKVCAVSQTTLDRATFDSIVDFLNKTCREPEIYNTICSATSERQREAAYIAQNVDLMIVIGGKHSSNTNKLAAICSSYCGNTYQIESFEEFPQNIDIPRKIGITAGASAPSCIIKEVVLGMEEKLKGNEFAQAFEEYEKSLITLNTRDIVKGTVIAVSDAGVSVNLGFKSDGFVPASEVTDDPNADIKELVKVGDEVEVFVVRVNDVEGEVTLSMKKIAAMKGVKEIEDAFETKEVLTGKVVQSVKGGVIVVCKGVRIFIPLSQASDRYVAEPETLVGSEVSFRIIDIKKMRGRTKIVGSVKSVLKEQKEALAADFWANVEVGKHYQGVIKSITNFGAFADIGGVDGLIHISELSWSKIKHPSEVVKEGDVVDVYVIEFDKEKNKVSLGYKKTEDDPWIKVKNELSEGSVIDCKIVRIVPFGAFAEIYPGVDGLIHISQVANKRIGKVEDELTVGQHVQAKVVELDLDNQKIGLSIRALLEPETNEDTEVQNEAAEESAEAAQEAPADEQETATDAE